MGCPMDEPPNLSMQSMHEVQKKYLPWHSMEHAEISAKNLSTQVAFTQLLHPEWVYCKYRSRFSNSTTMILRGSHCKKEERFCIEV